MKINYGDAVLAWCEKYKQPLPSENEVEILNRIKPILKPPKKHEWLIEEENGGYVFPIKRFNSEEKAKKCYKKYKNIDSRLTELFYGIPVGSLTGIELLKKYTNLDKKCHKNI